MSHTLAVDSTMGGAPVAVSKGGACGTADASGSLVTEATCERYLDLAGGPSTWTRLYSGVMTVVCLQRDVERLPTVRGGSYRARVGGTSLCPEWAARKDAPAMLKFC